MKDQTVLVIGRGGGLARAIVLAARDAGAQVIAAGRDQGTLDAVYGGEPGISTESVDLTDEASIAALGEQLGAVDHVVSTASAWSYHDAWLGVRRISGLISFEPDKVPVHLDGTRLRLEPGQTVVPHGIDRDLTADEAGPGRQP